MKRSGSLQWLVVCLISGLSLASPGVAQTSSGGSYSITQKVIAGGGATSSGGRFEIAGTVGQHDAAISAGGLYQIVGGFWPEPEFSSPTPICALDVTAQLNITPGDLKYNSVTNSYLQKVTIQNDGKTTIVGPLAYVLDSLSPNGFLINLAGSTTCVLPASPYQIVATGAGNELPPGGVVTLTLEFTNALPRRPITYVPRILAGDNR
jgi:hypothetical protein